MEENLVRDLYERYKDGIFRYILSMTADRYLSEDILQETFVKLLHTGILPDVGKEQAWLYKVARNKCFDVIRRRKKYEELTEIVVPEPDENWEFFDLISPLNEKDREIISLRFVGGFSHKEIAKITGATVSATKKRYERAIKKLRDMEENND